MAELRDIEWNKNLVYDRKSPFNQFDIPKLDIGDQLLSLSTGKRGSSQGSILKK